MVIAVVLPCAVKSSLCMVFVRGAIHVPWVHPASILLLCNGIHWGGVRLAAVAIHEGWGGGGQLLVVAAAAKRRRGCSSSSSGCYCRQRSGV